MEIKNKVFAEERALFGSANLDIESCTFDKGESPIKECSSLNIKGSHFKWKYPIWYCRDTAAEGCVFYEGARAGMWYNENLEINNSRVLAPKCFRRCKNLSLENSDIPNAEETLWSCDGVKLNNVGVKGDYFAMNCKNIEADRLELNGKYAFDGVENAVIRNSKIITKDAFWNSKNVTVYDSYISGEYLAWNSENVTFINCTVESLQGLCYIENLKLLNCKLINTSLAFEGSSVEAQIDCADSVFDPKSGVIKADKIGCLVLSGKNDTKIICDNIYRITSEPDWSEIL